MSGTVDATPSSRCFREENATRVSHLRFLNLHAAVLAALPENLIKTSRVIRWFLFYLARTSKTLLQEFYLSHIPVLKNPIAVFLYKKIRVWGWLLGYDEHVKDSTDNDTIQSLTLETNHVGLKN